MSSPRTSSYPAPYASQHKAEKLNGPGDARPTGIQIARDQDLVGKFVGKVALVTGCSSGIGVETARALHVTGSDVYITVRNMDKGQEVAKDIASDNGPGKVEVIHMELDSFESVKAGAKEFLQKSNNKLNILVNNAGVMACPEGKTKDGWETQFGTNHLGHFLLFQSVKDALLSSSSPDFGSRVVSVSSMGHRAGSVHFDDFNLEEDGYSPWKAYGQSKTSNIWFANEITRRYGDKGINALSLHPGGIETPLQRHLSKEWLANMNKPEIIRTLKSTAQGAATSVWAALAREWEGKGGLYLEDCQVSDPIADDAGPGGPGYQTWAYDAAGEKRLWAESLKIVGIPDDQ